MLKPEPFDRAAFVEVEDGMQQEPNNPGGNSTDEQKPAEEVRRGASDPPRRKRGAFPTPRNVIDSATPYVPESYHPDDPADVTTDSPPTLPDK